MWKCPHCAEEMRDSDDQCWNCATRNPSLPALDGTGELSQMKKCPSCAEMIRSEAVKCRFCGSVVAEEGGSDRIKAAHPEKRPGRKLRMSKAAVIVTAILVFSVIAVCAAVLLSRPAPGADDRGAKISAPGPDHKPGMKGVPYEEVVEYDKYGKIIKTTKSYSTSK